MRCLGAVAAVEAEGLSTEAVICEIPAERSDRRSAGMSPEGEMY